MGNDDKSHTNCRSTGGGSISRSKTQICAKEQCVLWTGVKWSNATHLLAGTNGTLLPRMKPDR